jgi:CheY-specific phosphatase CheX
MPDLGCVLDDVTSRVLETMFFSAVLGPATGEVDGTRCSAAVTFSGARSGSLSVSARPETAAALASSFLAIGDEEIPSEQVNGVFGELANVLCGAVLGALEPCGQFTISPPQVSGVGPLFAANVTAVQLAEGNLAVGLTIV